MSRFFAALAASLLLLTTSPAQAEDWNLILLSTGDTEGQLQPGGGQGAPESGGYARLATAIKALKSKYSGKTLLLSAGEDLIGPYYKEFYGAPIFEAMRMMGFDAGALANHEFDLGDAFLAKALKNCSFPLVESNLSTTPGSPLHGAFRPWVMLEINGLKIGVFGIMNAALPTISKPGPLVAVSGDYLGIARDMASTLRQNGADLVVALAQVGLAEAQDLAAKAEEIDVICVGDSDLAVSRGRELLRRPDGRIAVVTQTGQKGAYLGSLKLTVKNGRIEDYFWNLIPMDASVPEDPAIKRLVDEYEAKLPKDELLATASVPLDVRKTTLRTAEAGMGDFVCDALRETFDVDAAIYNGGGIRGDRIMAEGPVKAADIREMFPFGDSVIIMTLTGKELYQAFERSAAALPEPAGAFLQVSGLRVEYDPLDEPMVLEKDARGDAVGVAKPGRRVRRLELCDKTGACAPVDPGAKLKIAASAFLAGGGDGYVMFRDAPKKDSGRRVEDVVMEALRAKKTISPVTDGRIAASKR